MYECTGPCRGKWTAEATFPYGKCPRCGTSLFNPAAQPLRVVPLSVFMAEEARSTSPDKLKT